MPFTFDLSDELKETIRKLSKKDKETVHALNKKINQIIAFDQNAIDHFKNLRHGLSEYKRVHISKSFVLFFTIDKKNNYVWFESLKHHDEAYK